MSRRKGDAIDYPKKIAIIEEFLKKDRKKYHDLKDELTFVPSSKDKWFSFADGHFYPFCIVDSNSLEKCLDRPYPIEIELTVKNNSSFTPYEQRGEIHPKQNGVFWWKYFKSHIKGTLVLKIRCDDEEVEPLVHEFKIIEDDKNKPQSTKKEKEGKEQQANKRRRSSSGQAVDVEDEEDQEDEEMGRKILIDSSEIGYHPNRRDEARVSARQSLQFFQGVRDLPQFIPLHVRQRLEIPLSSANHTPLPATTTNQSFKFGLHSQIKIPHSLLSCLYNDKAIISPSVIVYLQAMLNLSVLLPEEKPLIKREKKEMEVGFKRFMSPSAEQILNEIQGRASQIASIRDLTLFLRVLFDQLLFTHILYEEERELFQQFLGVSSVERRSQKEKSHLGHFGPYYFLRFLIVVLMNLSGGADLTNLPAKGTQEKQLNDLEKFVDISLRYLDEQFSSFFA